MATESLICAQRRKDETQFKCERLPSLFSRQDELQPPRTPPSHRPLDIRLFAQDVYWGNDFTQEAGCQLCTRAGELPTLQSGRQHVLFSARAPVECKAYKKGQRRKLDSRLFWLLQGHLTHSFLSPVSGLVFWLVLTYQSQTGVRWNSGICVCVSITRIVRQLCQVPLKITPLKGGRLHSREYLHHCKIAVMLDYNIYAYKIVITLAETMSAFFLLALMSVLMQKRCRRLYKFI